MVIVWRRAVFALCVLPLVFGFVLLGVLWPVLWVFTGKGFDQLSEALADFIVEDFYGWASPDQEDK
jgi:hypothetical protein